FFLSSRRRHTRSKRDWSSDVCSSDLISGVENGVGLALRHFLLVEGHHIGRGQAGFFVVKTPYLLEMRCGDFFHILTDLDLGDDRSEERRVGTACGGRRWSASLGRKRT